MDLTIRELERSLERAKQRAGIATQYYLLDVGFDLVLISGPAGADDRLEQARKDYDQWRDTQAKEHQQEINTIRAQFSRLRVPTIEEVWPTRRKDQERIAEIKQECYRKRVTFKQFAKTDKECQEFFARKNAYRTEVARVNEHNIEQSEEAARRVARIQVLEKKFEEFLPSEFTIHQFKCLAESLNDYEPY